METFFDPLKREMLKGIEIWDAHIHLGRGDDGKRLNVQELKRIMKRLGITGAVVFPLNDPRPQKNFEVANREIYEICRRHHELIPFFRLNPGVRWKNEFALRVKQGFQGIKLHPRVQNFSLLDPNVMEIYEAAERNDLAILLHTGYGLMAPSKEIEQIVRRYRNLKLILAHATFFDLKESIRRLESYRNVVFEISTVRLFDLFELLKKADSRRIVYGSDMPYVGPDYAIGAVYTVIEMLGLKTRDMQRMFSGNLKRLLA